MTDNGLLETWDEKQIYARIGKKYGIINPHVENGVIFLFGACFKDFLFSGVMLKSGYPDATAYSRIFNRRISIEFEYRSSNFIIHKHDIGKVDLIICWSHDAYWLRKPVLELRSGRVFIFYGSNDIKTFDWRYDDPKIIKGNIEGG